MKTFMQLGLILVLGIAFGQAFFLGDLSEERKAMYRCHLTHKVSSGSGYICRDEEKLEMCLKKIVPVNEEDKVRQNDLINDSVNRRNECPGFVGTLICRDSESTKCKQSFSDKQLLNDDSICQELQEVQDCLVRKLNDSCSQNILQEEFEEVDKVDQDCQRVNFNGGPCSDDSIFACHVSVILDDNWNWDNNFKCNDTLLANAKACLSSLKSKCKTKHQQDEIRKAISTLGITCSED